MGMIRKQTFKTNSTATATVSKQNRNTKQHFLSSITWEDKYKMYKVKPFKVISGKEAVDNLKYQNILRMAESLLTENERIF